jgi:hypothetical protein
VATSASAPIASRSPTNSAPHPWRTRSPVPAC